MSSSPPKRKSNAPIFAEKVRFWFEFQRLKTAASWSGFVSTRQNGHFSGPLQENSGFPSGIAQARKGVRDYLLLVIQHRVKQEEPDQ